MRPVRVRVTREIRSGRGAEGHYRVGDAVSLLPLLAQEYAGKVKLIYLDPPYLTGDRFYMRVRVGASEWKSGRGTLALHTFSDKSGREKFLEMMREVLTVSRELLTPDGMVFVHIDYRASAHIRLLMDELFGEENFLNEIVWSYQSGGRATKHFSRKHDVILFYRKGEEYDFHMEDVMVVPAAPRNNHMRRHVDPDGRVYRSIRSGGKVYTYYDDDPIAPSDVWTDISHLQQRDPERTGYDTQKPLALLNRIIRCASREGDLVADLFAGSCTTLASAQRNGRRFIGMDACPLTLNIARHRLGSGALTMDVPRFSGNPDCELDWYMGIGFWNVTLKNYVFEEDALPEGADVPEGLDAVDSWSVGYVREDGYHVMEESIRTHDRPELQKELMLPVYSGMPAVCVCDVLGRSYYYALETDTRSNAVHNYEL